MYLFFSSNKQPYRIVSSNNSICLSVEKKMKLIITFDAWSIGDKDSVLPILIMINMPGILWHILTEIGLNYHIVLVTKGLMKMF